MPDTAPTPAVTREDQIKELVAAHTEAVQNGGVVTPRLKSAVNALTGSLEPEVAQPATVETPTEVPPPVDQLPTEQTGEHIE